MANCKYCHEPITRLDKDVCPFCGGKRPLDGQDTSTQDVTKIIEQIEGASEIKHKKRIVAALLAFFLGVFGVHSFYLGKIKHGLITLLISALFIGGLGTILYFVALKSILAYIIPLIVMEIGAIIVGVGFLTRHDLVDSDGEFLE